MAYQDSLETWNNQRIEREKFSITDDYTDCSVLCTPTILKTFEIRPNRTTFSCFTGPKVIQSHASMRCMTF